MSWEASILWVQTDGEKGSDLAFYHICICFPITYAGSGMGIHMVW